MDTTERQNRTLICSVLFVDIVEYSLKPVAEQIKLKNRLNALLTEVLQDVALNDRVVLDTGDGAAIGFLGDPEDALFAALSLRDGSASRVQSPAAPEMALRMGVNLGPVKLVKDLNGQRNIIGDGINVAQRVMSYSTPGQVLVSRSYFEVVSRLSEEFSRMFHYEGARTDKHVREHEIYAVVSGGGELKHAPDEPADRDREEPAASAVMGHSTPAGVAMRSGLGSRTKLGAALAALLVLGAAVAVVVHRNRPNATDPYAQKPASSQPSPVVAQAPVPQSPHAEVKAAASAPKVAVSPEAKRAHVPPPAVLRFAITPWGEIFVDGKEHGASPPLRELRVAPGLHKIEIRNSGFPSHVASIDVKPGARIEIKYIFH